MVVTVVTLVIFTRTDREDSPNPLYRNSFCFGYRSRDFRVNLDRYLENAIKIAFCAPVARGIRFTNKYYYY